MQNLQSGDEKGQRASAISDGDIGNKFVGMRNEGMTEQQLVWFFDEKAAEPAMECKQKSYSARKRGE